MVEIERNRCDCHPETCNCHRWKVVDSDGKVIYTTDDFKQAESIRKLFNN